MKNNIIPVIFRNAPISDEKDDVFDFETQVDILETAIDNNATLIGIIGDYGSGKSTLAELSKKRLQEKYGTSIQINLWDTFIKKNDTDTADIGFFTRSFFFQLAQGVNSHFAQYINERQNIHYGKLSLTMASQKALWWFLAAGLFLITFFTVTNNEVFTALLTLFKEGSRGIGLFRILKSIAYVLLLFAAICAYKAIKVGAFVFSLWESLS